jgi:flagellar biosynthetic protein FlhB
VSEVDNDQKTEAPSGKRLDEAREHGQVPVSRETATWVVMLAILMVMGWMLPPMARHLSDYLRGFLESPHLIQLNENSAQALLFQTLGAVGLICSLVFLVLMAAAIAGVMVQTGFFFALDLLSPDLERLLPSRGLKKLFSSGSLVEFGKSIGKLVFLGGMAFSVLVPISVEAPGYTGLPLENILEFLQQKVMHLIIMLVLGFTVIAVLDLFFIRYQYIKNLRMTKTEVKDEYKQQEGDPAIKGRLRQLRVEKARKRMMAQVPKADVVITNPTHYAVALKYDGSKMAAPVVLAKGVNLIADRIRALAEENRIPLVSNPPLARALHDTVEIDHPIPGEHYRAVAEVISYVYKLRKRKF